MQKAKSTLCYAVTSDGTEAAAHAMNLMRANAAAGRTIFYIENGRAMCHRNWFVPARPDSMICAKFWTTKKNTNISSDWLLSTDFSSENFPCSCCAENWKKRTNIQNSYWKFYCNYRALILYMKKKEIYSCWFRHSPGNLIRITEQPNVFSINNNISTTAHWIGLSVRCFYCLNSIFDERMRACKV